MKNTMRKAVALSTVTVAAIAAAGVSWAQPAPKTTRAALEGSWTLVSIVNEKDGVKSDSPMGANPLGLFIYDRGGRYSVQIYRQGLAPIAANDRNKGTAEEYKAIMQGSLSHFGTYTVDEKAGTFTIRPVAGNYPNWVGKDQPRKFTVTGDELKILNPSSSGDPASKSYLTLKRAK